LRIKIQAKQWLNGISNYPKDHSTNRPKNNFSNFINSFYQVHISIFYKITLSCPCFGRWVGKANNGVAIFGVGFALWCEQSEHDKANLANYSISTFRLFPLFLFFGC